jgi:sirohydrochlorin cobaltochelatase
MEQGFERAWTWQAKRVIVLPYFLFTGVLVKRIHEMAQLQQQLHPEVQIQSMNEVGLDPVLFDLIREREQEARSGQVMMNCEMCKFRRAVSQQLVGLGQDNEHHHQLVEAVHRDHGHEHAAHSHSHGHGHTHEAEDPYAEPTEYHQRIWQIP